MVTKDYGGQVDHNWGDHHVMQRIRGQAGFTLIETMTTLAIVALGVALSLPSFLQWNARYQLRQAVTEVGHQLVTARMTAMTRNATVDVGFATSGGRVTMSANDVGGRAVFQPSTLMPHITALSGGPVVFTSLGVRSGGGTGNQQVVLTNSEGVKYSIKITPGGKVSWCATAVCP